MVVFAFIRHLSFLFFELPVLSFAPFSGLLGYLSSVNLYALFNTFRTLIFQVITLAFLLSP